MTSRRQQPTAEDPPPADFEAFREFCVAARTPSRARPERVLEHDWSGCPMLRRLLEDLPRPVTPDALHVAARSFLEQAVEALAPLYPPSREQITPIEAFRRHVLEGNSGEAIRRELLESGLNVSLGTLKNRRRAAMLHILAWAREKEPAEGAPIRWRRWHPAWISLAVLLLVGVPLAAWLLGARHRRSEPLEFPAPLVGVSIDIRETQVRLDPPYPPLELPELGSPIRCALLLPPRHRGDARFLLGTDGHGRVPGDLFLWDVVSDGIVWHTEFSVAPESLMVMRTLGPEVGHDSLGVKRFVYRGEQENLGGRAVAILRHFYAPSAAVLLEVETGIVEGVYIHPGHLTAGTVLPAGPGGAAVVVLSGTDNVEGRATVLALDPVHFGGAASTVWYKRHDPTEDALWRVLFPPIEPIERSWALRQMHVDVLADRYWNAVDRTLRVPVGRGDRQVAYFGLLRLGEARVDSVWVELGDSQVRLWQEHGLDVDSLRAALQEQLMVVDGPFTAAVSRIHAD